MSDLTHESKIPALGKRGGGWVFLQVVLFWVLIGAGVRGKGDVAGSSLLLAVGVGTILIVLGAAIIFAGIRGLHESVTPMPKPKEDGTLVVEGVYGYVRHPIYLGVILVAFGWSAAMDSVPALFTAVVYVVFFDLKSRREEVWLREAYPDYAVYAAHTRRFVPYVY